MAEGDNSGILELQKLTLNEDELVLIKKKLKKHIALQTPRIILGTLLPYSHKNPYLCES